MNLTPYKNSQERQGHGFPDIIDNFAGDAVSFELNNGKKLMQLSGSLNQAPGRFEWIVDPRLGGVSHRMFIVNGSINGIPVKP
jgi:filamentous hemagglutinin